MAGGWLVTRPMHLLPTYLLAEDLSLHHLLELRLADVPLLLSAQQRTALDDADSKPPGPKLKFDKARTRFGRTQWYSSTQFGRLDVNMKKVSSHVVDYTDK